MNLQIRNPRARQLAQKLADKRGVSLTEAVIEALEAQLDAEPAPADKRPLADRLRDIAEDLAKASGGRGRDMTKEEIDRMWGHD